MTASYHADISQLHLSMSAMNNTWETAIINLNSTISRIPSSMIPDWPDAIGCTVEGEGLTIFYLMYAPRSTNNNFYYRRFSYIANYRYMFNNDGTFNSTVNIANSDCDDKSIRELKSAGQAFNFVISL